MAERTTSISSNGGFIDTIYFYQIYRTIVENPEENNETRRTAYERMVEHYISLIIRCLQGIYLNESNKMVQTEYVNYFFWNEDVMHANLDEFKLKLQSQMKKTQNETSLLDEIEKQLEAMKQAKVKFLKLDNNELGKVMEYVQAYRIVKDSKKRQVNMRLMENLSYRFVDYLNTLTAKRCNIEGFGRAECKYDDLTSEAEFILTKLNDASNLACYQLTKSAWEAFISFRKTDETNRISQDQEIAAALDFSHVRANETRLEYLQRQLKEACEKINMWLQKKLNQTFQLFQIISAPIFHPFNTAKNVCSAIANLISTKEALEIWTKQNKWTARIIIVSGLIIGATATVLVISHLMAGTLVMSLAGKLLVCAAVGTMPILAAAGEGGLLVRNADKEIQDEISKSDSHKKKVLDEVEPMKRSLRNEEYVRAKIRTAKQEAERELAIIIRAEEESARQLDQNLSIMSHEEIAPALNECKEDLILVTTELTEVRSTRKAVISNLNEMRKDHRIIDDAQSAAIRIQNRAKDSFAEIGVTKRMMNLEEMDIEARKSNSPRQVNFIILSFVVLIICWWFY